MRVLVVALMHLFACHHIFVAYCFAVIVPNWVKVLLVPPYKVVVNQVPVTAVLVEHQVGWSDVPVIVPLDMQLV